MVTARDKAAIDAHITREQQWDDAPPPEVVLYVTKTVATIVRDDGSGLHPVEAAYVAIAKDDSDGRFEFTVPHEDGSRGRYVVTVEREFTPPTNMMTEQY